MDPSIFKNPNGKLYKNKKKDYFIFIPNILPLDITFTTNNLKKLELANNYLGKLSGLIDNLPNPNLFINPYIRKEAVLSSKIEGTRSSLSDILKYDLDKKNINDDLKEILNYIKALNYGLEKIKYNNISKKLILELNKILLKDVRGDNENIGEIRNIQNWIGEYGSNLKTSLYNPPNPEKINKLIDNLIEYINKEDQTPILIKSAIIHYQFEAIHPFIDGNGRVGRLLIILYLSKFNLLDKPILYLSEYFEKEKIKYYENILYFSTNSDYNKWIDYFLEGIIIQSKKTSEKVKQLIEYRNKTRSFLKNKNNNTNILKIFDYLFQNPYINVIKSKEILNINNYNTGKRNILKLVKYGILTLDKKDSKKYVAEEINKILLK